MVTLNMGLSILILVSFVLVFLVFNKFFWKPITRVIKDREELIESEIESAKKLRTEAEALRKENDEIIAKTRKEAERIVDEAKRNAERIHADVVQTARIEASFIIDQSKKVAEFERAKVIDNLKQDITNLTLLATEKVIKRMLTPEENKNFVIKTIDTMVE